MTKSRAAALAALSTIAALAVACGGQGNGRHVDASAASVTRDGQCGVVSATRDADVFRLSVAPGEVYALEAQDGGSRGALATAARSGKAHCVFGRYDYAAETALVSSAADVRPVKKK